MTAQQLEQVKTLFESLIELSPEERESYLQEHCYDLLVRNEVEFLLAKQQQAQAKQPNNISREDNTIADTHCGNVEAVPYFTNLIGKTLNNTYLIEEKLGEGGMGVVFRGSHLLLGNKVAIKVMTPSLKREPNDVKRFQREARVGWALAHPNIIKVLEFSQTEDGILFMVMELVKGENLRSYLRSAAPLTLHRTEEILKPLCDALDAAHRRNILHRDLKPENILLSQEDDKEVVKLADFGIVKLLKPDDQLNTSGSALTTMGSVIGSPLYMSPEQLMDYKLSPSSDIYSLGIVLYEMLTKELPIEGIDLRETLKLKASYRTLPPPSSIYRFLPTTLDEVLQKVLSPIPQERYQKAGELYNAYHKAITLF